MKIDKSWYTKPGDPNFPTATAAGGVVIRRDKDKLYTALLRDKKYKDYLLPKGGVDKGETIEEAARREIAEEAGLSNLKMIAELGIKTRLTFEKNQWRRIHYFLFETDQEKAVQNLQVGEEDYVMEWHDLDELPPMFWPEQKEIIEDNRKKIKKLLS